MLERILLVSALAVVGYLLIKWTKTNTGEDAYEEYSKPKPPLYVYYNTAGLSIPIQLYFTIAALAAFLLAALTNRQLNNMVAAIIVMFIALNMARQYIIIRSIRNSSRIDSNAPGFLTFFGNVMMQMQDPISALGLCLKYADRTYQGVLETLYNRLKNGQDPYLEIDRAKRYFRNRVIRNFLDDMCDHLHKGNILNASLERLIQRAQDRLTYAAERKIETYAGVLVIYGGLAVEATLVGIVSLIQPQLLDVFVSTPLGQLGVWVIVSISGFMLLIAQRLILLSEG